MSDAGRAALISYAIMMAGLVVSMAALLFTEPKFAALIGMPLVFVGGAFYFGSMIRAFWKMWKE